MILRSNILAKSLLLAAFLVTFCPVSAKEKQVLALETVVIDAGHGGHDPGTVWEDVREKDINLDVAIRFGSMLKAAYPKVNVIYTRDKDVYIPLDERSSIANRNRADLFISIHVNAMKGSTASNGSETFLMGTDKSGSNMNVCKQENSVILLEDDYSTKYAGYDPDSPDSFIFFNLMQSAQFDQSILMASLVEKELSKGPISHSRGIKQAPLLVLWKTTMPSVLVEIGFLSNAGDRAKLQERKNRAAIAKCLLNAFAKFKEQYEITGERPAGNASPSPADTVGSGAAVKAEPMVEHKAEPNVKPKSEPKVEPKTPEVKVASDNAGSAPYKSKWRIQIMVSSRMLKSDNPVFKGLKSDFVKKGDLYYYFTGVFDSRSDAVEKLPSIREQFPGSFIVAFDADGNPVK